MDTQKPPLLRLSALLAVVLACTARCAQGADDAVVVNSRAAIAALSDEDLRDLFLGKKTVWDDGTKVVVVVLKTGPSHDALLRRLGRNPQQFLTGWKKLVFTGKSSMPEQVASEDDLVEVVAHTPGAIGYIDAGKVKDGVKAVPVN
jgi:ABC-type phosphate transport system substrate-binding protein